MRIGALGIPIDLDSANSTDTHSIIEHYQKYYTLLNTDSQAGSIGAKIAVDQRVKSLEGKMISNGHGSASIFDKLSLTLWHLWNANNNGFSRANEDLENFLNNDHIDYQFALWINGVFLNHDLQLEDGIRIVPIHNMPLSHEKSFFSQISILNSSMQPRAAIVFDHSCPKLVSPGAPPSVDPVTLALQTKASDYACLLNSIQDLTCTPHYSTTYTNRSLFSGSGGGRPLFDVAGSRSNELTQAKAALLIRVMQSFAQKDDAEKDRLRRILMRLSQGKRRLETTDKVLDLGIALEMVLLNDNTSSSQLSLSFRLRGSWWLAADESERATLYERLKILYELRSQVAHSGKLSLKTPVLNEELASFETLADRMVQKLILNGKPNWDETILGIGKET